jgi:hypothetical protein
LNEARCDGIFTGKTRFDLTPAEEDELWSKGVLGTPETNWVRDEPWDVNNPERVPCWHYVEPDTQTLITGVAKLTSEQAADVLAEIAKRAKPARDARAELEAYTQTVDDAILKKLSKKSLTKFALVEELGDFNPVDVSSRLLALTRAGKLKTKRVYVSGSGYITTYHS